MPPAADPGRRRRSAAGQLGRGHVDAARPLAAATRWRAPRRNAPAPRSLVHPAVAGQVLPRPGSAFTSLHGSVCSRGVGGSGGRRVAARARSAAAGSTWLAALEQLEHPHIGRVDQDDAVRTTTNQTIARDVDVALLVVDVRIVVGPSPRPCAGGTSSRSSAPWSPARASWRHGSFTGRSGRFQLPGEQEDQSPPASRDADVRQARPPRVLLEGRRDEPDEVVEPDRDDEPRRRRSVRAFLEVPRQQQAERQEEVPDRPATSRDPPSRPAAGRGSRESLPAGCRPR